MSLFCESVFLRWFFSYSISVTAFVPICCWIQLILISVWTICMLFNYMCISGFVIGRIYDMNTNWKFKWTCDFFHGFTDQNFDFDERCGKITDWIIKWAYAIVHLMDMQNCSMHQGFDVVWTWDDSQSHFNYNISSIKCIILWIILYVDWTGDLRENPIEINGFKNNWHPLHSVRITYSLQPFENKIKIKAV